MGDLGKLSLRWTDGWRDRRIDRERRPVSVWGVTLVLGHPARSVHENELD